MVLDTGLRRGDACGDFLREHQNRRFGISSIRAQIRTAKETSLIVNGGHYMTRGHVIVRMLYIKDVPDVKNYFGTGRGPFRVCKRTPAEGVFAPASIDEFLRILDGFVKSPQARCVLFNTSTPCRSDPFYPRPLPAPRTGGPLPESKGGKETAPKYP